jgi:hypothetical protein
VGEPLKRTLGIVLALFLDMRKFVATALLISLTVTPFVSLAQQNSSEVAQNQQRAGQVADRFMELFRQRLDFGIAWKAFRMSDPSCTHRANGSLSEEDYDRLKLNTEIIEKLYIATMNLYFLKSVYELSVARLDSKSTSKDPPTPGKIEVFEKKSKFFQNDDLKLQSSAEISELIATLDQLAQLYREYLPKHAMRSANWRANQKYLISKTGLDHSSVLNGDSTLCVPEQTKVYIVDRGIFYFYMVEEGGKMKVAGLGID